MGGDKAGFSESTPYGAGQDRELQQVGYIWAYVGGARVVSETTRYGGGERQEFQKPHLMRAGQTSSCSKQAIYGDMSTGKGRASQTTPHEGGVRQGVPAGIPYTSVWG